MLSANSLRWSAAHCAKILSSYDRFVRGKRWKSQGTKIGRIMGDQTLPMENASGASLLQLAVCGRALSWRRTILEDNIPPRLFWNKGIELQHALHIWRETLLFLGMLTGSLRARNWQVRCVSIDGHTTDIAQHICAKLHLILIVVLILDLEKILF